MPDEEPALLDDPEPPDEEPALLDDPEPPDEEPALLDDPEPPDEEPALLDDPEPPDEEPALLDDPEPPDEEPLLDEPELPDEEPALLEDPGALLEPLLDAEAVAWPDDVPPSARFVPLEPEPEHPRRASDAVRARIFSGFILPIPHVRGQDGIDFSAAERLRPSRIASQAPSIPYGPKKAISDSRRVSFIEVEDGDGWDQNCREDRALGKGMTLPRPW